ncbi:MAG TPA: riboflavin synthase [Rhodanobacteraceae bacterium]|nr:riboflavin synthase [Rhodanobacteraceae bacterium]
MFSGIIQTIGRVGCIESHGHDIRLAIEAEDLDFSDVHVGDSIAVTGVCLTVVKQEDVRFVADVSAETLACTTLGSLAVGDAVNLEKALRLADRLGGHLVSGHIDGVGRVLATAPDGRSQRWTFEAPPALARYIAAKGSICVDGVSLTVNEVEADRFGVNLVPHTLARTTFGSRRPGDAVNLEVDLVARHVERLFAAGEPSR